MQSCRLESTATNYATTDNTKTKMGLKQFFSLPLSGKQALHSIKICVMKSTALEGFTENYFIQTGL